MSAPEPPDEDQMCPNCVTPWKCNGPHLRTDGQWQPVQYPDLEYDEEALAAWERELLRDQTWWRRRLTYRRWEWMWFIVAFIAGGVIVGYGLAAL